MAAHVNGGRRSEGRARIATTQILEAKIAVDWVHKNSMSNNVRIWKW
jgi:hypothetical protein